MRNAHQLSLAQKLVCRQMLVSFAGTNENESEREQLAASKMATMGRVAATNGTTAKVVRERD